MILTIDVGNTSTGIAVFDNDKIIHKNKLLTPQEADSYFVDNLINKEFKIDFIIISSVVPFINKSLENSLINKYGIKPIFINHKTKTGLKIKIKNPEELGEDRIANSCGALHFFSPPLLVIDSGTATTFDVVNKNFEYVGGVIYPGIDISIQSLANNTAKLEKIKFEIPQSPIGKDTVESIRAGIYYTYIGGIRYLIEEYKKIFSKDTKVVLTGGLIKYFKDKIKEIDLCEPDLIYFGLNSILKKLN